MSRQKRRTPATRPAPATTQDEETGAAGNPAPATGDPAPPYALSREQQARLRRRLAAKFH
ncbi:hypothetical protein [Streptomyces canus]|uniref:hypothetical protein n=1 Tax=Streptomyces canus TaxID=58343 RepID=UPI002DD9FD64|nr:hypothetical protein [Streptomyces canus]WSD92694.1 hypothetical protein OG925_51490 [Streptomyces canus]